MLLKILLAVAAIVVLVVAVFAVIVVMQPSEFRIQRSATIAAPAPAVFAQVNDFHNWEAWSPWAKLDPSAKNLFEGAPASPGTFVGRQQQSGRGHDDRRESAEWAVRIKLEFLKPRGEQHGGVHVQARGDRTAVTWSMYGQQLRGLRSAWSSAWTGFSAVSSRRGQHEIGGGLSQEIGIGRREDRAIMVLVKGIEAGVMPSEAPADGHKRELIGRRSSPAKGSIRARGAREVLGARTRDGPSRRPRTWSAASDLAGEIEEEARVGQARPNP